MYEILSRIQLNVFVAVLVVLIALLKELVLYLQMMASSNNFDQFDLLTNTFSLNVVMVLSWAGLFESRLPLIHD